MMSLKGELDLSTAGILRNVLVLPEIFTAPYVRIGV